MRALTADGYEDALLRLVAAAEELHEGSADEAAMVSITADYALLCVALRRLADLDPVVAS